MKTPLPTPDDTVQIELSADEAIVLFEFLARTDESGDYTPVHGGEVAALWRLEGALEKKVDLLFSPAYGDFLDAARERLAVKAGTQDEPQTNAISMVQECCESYEAKHRPDGGASIRIEADPRFTALWMIKLSELRTTEWEIKESEPDGRS